MHRILPLITTVCLLAGMNVPGSAEAEEDSSLEHLVPELAENAYRMDSGPRQFHKRISFSPGVGWVGSQKLFVFRLAYNPNSWLGYEASIGHNPGQSVSALFHMLNAIVRYPLPGRLQPYATVGYGMMMVFPGEAINADPVTENTLGYGVGIELYIRNDFAIRGELRGLTVLGGERDRAGTVAYNYREATFGFSFYRSLGK